MRHSKHTMQTVCLNKEMVLWETKKYLLFCHDQGNLKGGIICCGGHLAVMYGGELLHLRIFL